MSAVTGERPIVKGWCPGAYRPMVSGDGLVVRVRPWIGQLTNAQIHALCDVAIAYGSGSVELTNRANVQIRGVSEQDHEAVIAALLDAGLLDADPRLEARRNLVMTPDWQDADLSHDLACALMQALEGLPDLPGKFGYAIDTGAAPWLKEAPADIRFELGAGSELILVADGAELGRAVAPETAIDALRELVAWFVDTGGTQAGRMAKHLRAQAIPSEWAQVARRSAVKATPTNEMLLGVPFGQVDARHLAAFVTGSGVETLRVLPGRRLFVPGGSSRTPTIPRGFARPDDPLLNVHACIGAPGCLQALGPTRDIARALAVSVRPGETLHISGCIKGCAFPRAADRTLIATTDGFDLVSKGAPWDAPLKRGLSKDAILTDTTFMDTQS